MGTIHSSRSDSDVEGAIELSVLMPCLNELETIGKCISKAAKFLSENKVAGEIVVADNGSSDGSQALAEKLGARVVHVPQRGYGAALMGGIEASRGHYIVMGDSDDSYDFSNLMPFLDQLRGGADLVMGNRLRGGIAPGAMPWLHRYLGNPVLSFIGRVLFRTPVGDFHCGLRGFKASAIRGLGLRTTGMEFASEMVVRSTLAGLNVQEVPTALSVDGRDRPPHLRTWQDGWRHLKFLLMYSPRWLFLLPGSMLVLIGFILGTALVIGPLPLTGHVILGLNSFVGACFLVIVGTQLLTLGAIVRLFAMRVGFLPHSRRAALLSGWLTTDRLIQVAALLLAVGIVGTVWALWQWMKVDFGPLESPPLASPLVARILVGSLCAVVIAIQTVGFAFLAGILEIPFEFRANASDGQPSSRLNAQD